MIITSDEAYFQQDSYVNKKTCLHYAKDTPRELHRLKFTVWCDLSKGDVIGIYLFKDEFEQMVTGCRAICGYA